MPRVLQLIACIAAAAAGATPAGPGPHVLLNLDWAAFLSNFDPVWSWQPPYSSFIPTTWFTAAYTGNGVAGVLVKDANFTTHNDSLGSVLRLDIGHTEVWASGDRQPVAFLAMRFAGDVTSISMRMVLYQSAVVVNVTTTVGRVNATIFVDAHNLSASTVGVMCSVDGSEAPVWTYEPDLSGSSRNVLPNMTLDLNGTAGVHTQLLEAGTFAVAVSSLEYNAGTYTPLPLTPVALNDSWWGNTSGWRVPVVPPGTGPRQGHLFAVIVNTQRSAAPNSSATVAAAALPGFIATGLLPIFQAHTYWWADYWPASFVSFNNDTMLLSFYYIQMYRFASSARTRMHDLMGPYGPGSIDNCIGPWCQYCWDMNQQVMYYVAPASNRADVWAYPAFEMMIATYNQNFYDLYGAGDAGWSTQTLWLLKQMHKHILYTGNNSMLLTHLYPLLGVSIAGDCIQGTTNVSLPDGGYLYRVYGCGSPEYPYPCGASGDETNHTGILQQCSDCNYHISICNWALQTAIAIAESYVPGDAANVTVWRDYLEHSPPYPVDQNGYRISRELPFAYAHRHFSHLLMMYDLQLVGGEDYRSIMSASLDNWWNLTCADQQAGGFNEQCRGFTQAGMANMNTMLNLSDAARGNVSALLTSVISPNAFYGEDIYAGHPDEFSPVSESAYAAAGVVHEMLLQSNHIPPVPQAGYNDSAGQAAVIRLWAATPWLNASMYNLRTEGSFLVSAQRLNGVTVFASITPDANWTPMEDYGKPAPVVVWAPDWAAANLESINVYPTDTPCTAVPGIPGAFLLQLTRGGTNAILYTQPVMPPLIISPAGGDQPEFYNYYGYNWPFVPMH